MHYTQADLEFKINALLGEGPLWVPELQELYWVDIEGKALHIYNPKTKSDQKFSMPSHIGTVVPESELSMIVALVDGVYRFHRDTEQLERISDVESDVPSNRFNDGKCDPNGNLWVGSMHWEQQPNAARLYKVSPEGEATVMIDSVTISNGIVWSGDKRTMFYIDTPTGTIMAYDYNPADASIRNGRVAVNVDPEDGFPDGMAIDENDNLWIGLWNGGAVAHYDSASGALLGKIDVPTLNVTACAFGGPNLDVLYITTSSLGMTEADSVDYPDAGSVFKAYPGIKGLPTYSFGSRK